MTKKHFIKVAADIKWQTDRFAGDRDKLELVRIIASDLASTFASINSNFNRSTFMTACGF